MSLKCGILAACVAMCLGVAGVAARGDSILTAQPPNGYLLVENGLTITYNRSALSTGSVESFGTLSITAGSRNGQLNDQNGSSSVNFSPTFNPAAAFNITVGIDVKVDALAPTGYDVFVTGSTLMNIQGTDQVFVDPNFTNTKVAFNNSGDLGAFAINLNGSTVDPLAFMFVTDNSTYYSGANQGYVIAQLKKIATSSTNYPNGDPLVGQNFFVASGSKTWDTLEYKMDIFAVALPLPAPFYCGAIGILGVACVSTFIKKRRCA